MSSKEEQETLRRLVQHVSRAFYEPKLVVIMDQLARHAVCVLASTEPEVL
jgi:transcription initiation factor TFIIE subunit alpha